MNRSVVVGTCVCGAVTDAAGGGDPPSRMVGKNMGTGGGTSCAGLNDANADHVGSIASGAGGGSTSWSPGCSKADGMADAGRVDGLDV